MKNINKHLAVLLLGSAVLFSGCGTEDTDDGYPDVKQSSITVETGYYGSNGDLGTSETIRFSWTVNEVPDDEMILTLTSDVDTSLDSYLAYEFGAPHYHYSIAKVTEPGTYNIVCEPGVTSGTWIRYSCLVDGEYISSQDQSIDNGFVIEYTGSNRLHDESTTSGTVTLGHVSYPEQ